MNRTDTTYHPHMKTAVSNFRFERSTLKKRLAKYQEEHSKTLLDIAQNQRELTRSLSSEESEQQPADKYNYRRRACSLYGESVTAEKWHDQHLAGDSTTSYKLAYPVKTPTTASFLPRSKPTSTTSFVTSRSCSSARSSSVADSKPTYDKKKKVLKRQAGIESEVQRDLVEQTKPIITADQERSLRSAKVNKDAFKDQKHDKYKMNLTEKSQQTADKRSMNSLHEYESSKTTKQKDQGKSFFNLFKNKNPLPSVSKQYANSLTEPRDIQAVNSVNDISRTIFEPVIIKQRLRPSKSLSPISRTSGVVDKQRSKTFAGENQGSYPENLRKQVQNETKNANLNEQYLKRWHRNAWSESDDNYTEKSIPTPRSETHTPSLERPLRKQSDVKKHLSKSEKDQIVLDSTEIKEQKTIKCHEPLTSETREVRSEAVANHCKDSNDHVMLTTVAANHKSEGYLDTECHSPSEKVTENYKPGNGSEDNLGSGDNKALSVIEPQSKGWRKLRALPLTRIQQISEIGLEAGRKLPVLQDFKGRGLPDRPGLMSFRQVVLAAVKKDQQQSKKILISKERLNEIQQPTESFLRQTLDKKVMHYAAHAPRPPTQDRSKRGPEFHAVAKGIQGFQTLRSVVTANRLLRAEKIRKKSSFTRTQDVIDDRQKTISEMMDEVKNCRYLRNREHVT